MNSCLITRIIFYFFTGARREAFSCEICGKTYKIFRSLNRHARYECGRIGKRYECLHCDYRANYNFMVAKHTRMKHIHVVGKHARN